MPDLSSLIVSLNLSPLLSFAVMVIPFLLAAMLLLLFIRLVRQDDLLPYKKVKSRRMKMLLRNRGYSQR